MVRILLSLAIVLAFGLPDLDAAFRGRCHRHHRERGHGLLHRCR